MSRSSGPEFAHMAGILLFSTAPWLSTDMNLTANGSVTKIRSKTLPNLRFSEVIQMEMSPEGYKSKSMSTEPYDRQMTTDRLSENAPALLIMALPPKINSFVIILLSGIFSLGTWEAGLDAGHQSSVHIPANIADQLGGVLHTEPDPDQFQHITLSDEIEVASRLLAVKEVAETDKPGRWVGRRDWPINSLSLPRKHRRDRPFNCLSLLKKLSGDGGRGRPVPVPPGNSDTQGNRFSLNSLLPGSGQAAGVHLWIISNRDQMLRAGRQQSLHRQRRQLWRFARWLGPHDKLRVFANTLGQP